MEKALNLYEQILAKYWGHDSFRPLQDEIIKSVANGHDTLGLMPTGGGKSVTFQVPAMAREGLCLVITPLIALMRDQVDKLQQRDIKALCVHSGMSQEEIEIALDNSVFGDFKFLYVSPERLNTESFRNRVGRMKVNLVAIDESHCISQWGYDFRPSYLRIAELRPILPDVPFLALTATATPEVVNDIQEKLHFRERNVLRTSFERKNLVYLVRQAEDKFAYLLRIIQKVHGCGIVYVRSRRKARDLALWLKQQDVSADYYHAGLKPETRSSRQQSWTDGETSVMVATNAFGMGIDKPNVRFVVHIDLPDSIESYFQEAGRAGRDGKKAFAVLLVNSYDSQNLDKRIDLNFPPIAEVRRIYEMLCNYLQIPLGGAKGHTFDFYISDFADHYKLNLSVAHSSLKILEREGYLELTDEIHAPSKVNFTVGREDLYKFQVANASFDGFIKLLLRSYSGLFTDYVAIYEDFLARKAKIPVEMVSQYLTRLRQMEIIHYIPQRRAPMIVFTEERLEASSLVISRENYTFLRERYIERLHAMVQYAVSSVTCRSQLLLRYFGEKDAARCGQCDVCSTRNELNLSKYEFDMILEKIRDALHPNPLPLEIMVKQAGMETEKVLKVVRWLLDQGAIRYTGDQKLEWQNDKLL
jgi:ATP-dependent DNA helicase RecQ